MKKLNLKIGGIAEMLTKEQMKKVVGGYNDGGCGTSECSSNADCKDARYPKCYFTNCLSTGSPSNYCIAS